MSVPGLNAIFEYLALLISERTPDEPFLLSQIQPAITYKFPDFTFAAYGLANLKAFVSAGEQAGYFKLVHTGDIHTAHLVLGPRPRLPAPPSPATDLGADDPRRTRWMSETLEGLLSAERADQVISAIRGTNALSPEFDAFLAAQERTLELYPVRGKVRRLRYFLHVCRERGETQAMTTWQPSRILLKMPAVPPLREAPRAGAIITGLMQGKLALQDVPLESLGNVFFGVIGFYRRQLSKERAWDWVAGLEILEAEARAIPRPEPHSQKRGLFGGKTQPLVEPLDDAQIQAIAQRLLQEAGIRSTQDETTVWRAYTATESLEASYRFLAEQPALLREERLLIWLEDEIGRHVARGDMEGVRNLANRAAMVIAARKLGLDQVRQQPGELKQLYESILAGAQLLGVVLAYLGPGDTAQALDYLKAQQVMLKDETVGLLLDEQLVKAAERGDVERYRLVSERVDLWRNVVELGMEHGPTQHARFLAMPRDDRTLMTEMGLLLLQQTDDLEARRDILERYPVVATRAGLAMATSTLEMLSFQNVSPEEYNRYFEVKRLLERCLEIGIDRALAELK